MIREGTVDGGPTATSGRTPYEVNEKGVGQLAKTHRSKRPDLLYDIYVV